MELTEFETVFYKAKKYIYRNARPLDLMRWKFHFEKGSAYQVLEALAAYQNEDGGFGHALEEDSFNPESAPIQTWCATEILYEIGHTDGQHEIVKGILTYLDSGKDLRDDHWLAEIPSNNDYPHAPWWTYGETVYVKKSICTDTEQWTKIYTAYPSNFMRSKSSSLYDENKELAEYECKFILTQQLEDGSYAITWDWLDYANEWAVAKNWWKVNRTLLNLLYLKGFGYFEKKTIGVEMELKPVAKEIWYECVCLQVDQSQKHFVATNSVSLAQAAYEPEMYPYAIYAKGKMVGFIMYHYDSDLKMWGMCRLMIDRRYQKNGYGRVAVEKLFQLATEKLGHVQFYTSYEPDNATAGKLYASLGFIDTGDLIDGEKLMIKQL